MGKNKRKYKKSEGQNKLSITPKSITSDNELNDFSDVKKQLNKLLDINKKKSKSDFVEIIKLSSTLYKNETSSGWSKKDEQELMILLNEYNTLREESLKTIVNRTNIIFLGLAAIGALFGGSLSILEPGKNQNLISFLFSILIPLFVILILLIWVGEAMRMKRVNDYISSEIEGKINLKFGKFIIGWETLLNVGILPRDSYFGPSMVTLGIFFSLIFIAPVIGINLANINFEFDFGGTPIWQIWLPWSCGILLFIYLVIFRKRLIGDKIVKPFI